MRVYLGSDHAGYELKAAVLAHLTDAGHEAIDVGPGQYAAGDDYPPFCIETGRRVAADPDSLGVVIGGSGNGEQISANKVAGVRAALAWNLETARLAREHNNANVVSLGARMHDIPTALSFVDAFVGTAYSHDPRHQRRIDLISAYEADPGPQDLPA